MSLFKFEEEKKIVENKVVEKKVEEKPIKKKSIKKKVVTEVKPEITNEEQIVDINFKLPNIENLFVIHYLLTGKTIRKDVKTTLKVIKKNIDNIVEKLEKK